MAYFVDTEEGVRLKNDYAGQTRYLLERERMQNSPGYKAARDAEKEEIKSFFKKNNYYQLSPGEDKFKKGSFYYIVELRGPDGAKFL